MGVDYFGVLYEDDRLVVAVHLGSSEPDEKHERGAEALVELFEEARQLLSVLEEEQSVTSYNSIYALTRIAKLVEEATTPFSTPAMIYLAFCKIFNLKPRIVSEFELLPEEGRRKKVCVLNWKKCV